jgi:hypothetical protein
MSANGYPAPDLIVARHVLAHIDNWTEFFMSCAQISNPSTTLLIEVPWVVGMLDASSFDTIYHEHLSYVSVNSIIQVITGTGWFLTDVHQYPEIHGGSIGLVLRRGNQNSGNSINEALREEEALRIQTDYPWFGIRRVANLTQNLLRELLTGHPCGAYGAAAKGSVLLQWCSLDKSHLQFVVDTTPEKQGRLMPGTNIPIISPEQFRSGPQPPKMLVLPWNHLQAIIDSEPTYKGDWFIP